MSGCEEFFSFLKEVATRLAVKGAHYEGDNGVERTW